MEDTINPIKRFLKEFIDGRISPTEDDVQIRCSIIGNYGVKCTEVKYEVIDWALNFLEQRKCPHPLALTLAKKVAETSSALVPRFVGLASDDKEFVQEAPHLYSETIDLLYQLCSDWKDNLEQIDPLDLAPPRHEASVYAIKNIRRKMEDRHVVLHDLNALFDLQDAPPHSYYAVFDGHAGIEAASYASAHLHRNIVQNQHFLTDPETAIKVAFKLTDSQFHERAIRENLKSGCTAVCALVSENTLYLSWLGDSQALLVKQGKPVIIMNPHKPDREDERKRIEEMGGCVFHVGTWRVNGTLAVSRALGDFDYKPAVSNDADVCTVPLDGTEDFLVIACDGLWDKMTATDVSVALYRHLVDNPQEYDSISAKLVHQSKLLGSNDNITTIVVFLRDVNSLIADAPKFASVFHQPELIDASLHLYNGNTESHNVESKSIVAGCVPMRPNYFYEELGSPGTNEFPDTLPKLPEEVQVKKNESKGMPPEATSISELPTPPIDEVEASEYSTADQLRKFHSHLKAQDLQCHSFGILETSVSEDGTFVDKEIETLPPGILYDNTAVDSSRPFDLMVDMLANTFSSIALSEAEHSSLDISQDVLDAASGVVQSTIEAAVKHVSSTPGNPFEEMLESQVSSSENHNTANSANSPITSPHKLNPYAEPFYMKMDVTHPVFHEEFSGELMSPNEAPLILTGTVKSGTGEFNNACYGETVINDSSENKLINFGSVDPGGSAHVDANIFTPSAPTLELINESLTFDSFEVHQLIEDTSVPEKDSTNPFLENCAVPKSEAVISNKALNDQQHYQTISSEFYEQSDVNFGKLDEQLLPVSTEKLDAHLLPVSAFKLDELPVSIEKLDEQLLPVSREKLDEQLLPVSMEKLDEQLLPVSMEKLDEQLLPVSMEKLDEQLLPVSIEKLDEQLLPVSIEKLSEDLPPDSSEKLDEIMLPDNFENFEGFLSDSSEKLNKILPLDTSEKLDEITAPGSYAKFNENEQTNMNFSEQSLMNTVKLQVELDNKIESSPSFSLEVKSSFNQEELGASLPLDSTANQSIENFKTVPGEDVSLLAPNAVKNNKLSVSSSVCEQSENSIANDSIHKILPLFNPATLPVKDESMQIQGFEISKDVQILDAAIVETNQAVCVATVDEGMLESLPKQVSEKVIVKDSLLPKDVQEKLLEVTSTSNPSDSVTDDSQISNLAVDLQAIPDSIPEAEGVTEDVDSDSEKDGGWSYVTGKKSVDQKTSDAASVAKKGVTKKASPALSKDKSLGKTAVDPKNKSKTTGSGTIDHSKKTALERKAIEPKDRKEKIVTSSKQSSLQSSTFRSRLNVERPAKRIEGVGKPVTQVSSNQPRQSVGLSSQSTLKEGSKARPSGLKSHVAPMEKCLGKPTYSSTPFKPELSKFVPPAKAAPSKTLMRPASASAPRSRDASSNVSKPSSSSASVKPQVRPSSAPLASKSLFTTKTSTLRVNGSVPSMPDAKPKSTTFRKPELLTSKKQDTKEAKESANKQILAKKIAPSAPPLHKVSTSAVANKTDSMSRKSVISKTDSRTLKTSTIRSDATKSTMASRVAARDSAKVTLSSRSPVAGAKVSKTSKTKATNDSAKIAQSVNNNDPKQLPDSAERAAVPVNEEKGILEANNRETITGGEPAQTNGSDMTHKSELIATPELSSLPSSAAASVENEIL